MQKAEKTQGAYLLIGQRHIRQKFVQSFSTLSLRLFQRDLMLLHSNEGVKEQKTGERVSATCWLVDASAVSENVRWSLEQMTTTLLPKQTRHCQIIHRAAVNAKEWFSYHRVWLSREAEWMVSHSFKWHH